MKDCEKQYIIKKPLLREITNGFFTKKVFNTHCKQCLNCGWESEIVVLEETGDINVSTGLLPKTITMTF